MFYKPHILQVSKSEVTSYDELGVATISTSGWADVADCRCDLDSTQDLTNDAGQMYKSHYHVVAEKTDDVNEGDTIQCLNKQGRIVGKGIVRQLKYSNIFELIEFWV